MKSTNHFSSHYRLMTFALRVCLVSAILVVAAAPAPRGSIQHVGRVLMKTSDPNTPPTYPPEFWTDREQLSKDVEDLLRVMTDPANFDPET